MAIVDVISRDNIKQGILNIVNKNFTSLDNNLTSLSSKVNGIDIKLSSFITSVNGVKPTTDGEITVNVGLTEVVSDRDSLYFYGYNGDIYEIPNGHQILLRSKAYVVGDIAFTSDIPSWAYLECIKAGTSDAKPLEVVKEDVVVNKVLVDGSVNWLVKSLTEKVSILQAYPIGSLYSSINETSPSVLFGGSWEFLNQSSISTEINGSQNTIPIYIWTRIN